VRTRLPSNLRPTTRECVHLVRHDHFLPREEDGNHTVWSAISENPRIYANFMALCFIKLELLSIEVLHCGNRDFRSFLLLWPWPLPNDLYTRTWPVFRGDIPDVQIWTSYVKAFESYRLTDRHDRAGGQNSHRIHETSAVDGEMTVVGTLSACVFSYYYFFVIHGTIPCKTTAYISIHSFDHFDYHHHHHADIYNAPITTKQEYRYSTEIQIVIDETYWTLKAIFKR